LKTKNTQTSTFGPQRPNCLGLSSSVLFLFLCGRLANSSALVEDKLFNLLNTGHTN
ncbi:hypothetical protein SK128_017496, partial [Halocaridina rubra]